MENESYSAANDTENTIVCYAPTMITTNGVWQGDNPLDYSLPLFILQLTLVVVTTRILVFVLKPLRQPRVISEILGGVLLGPSVLGRSTTFAHTVFPLRSVMVLETMANVGLLYFLFLVGVEMDISVIRRTGKKAMAIALSGMILPFIIGAAFSFLMHKKSQGMNHGTFILFLGVALSVTAFPVLARILAELKLVNTELGKIALSSALVNDICAWILLAIAIALAENETTTLASLWVVLSSAGFVAVCFFVVRPAVSWMIQRTPEGETFSDFYICLILTGVLISGFVTDAIGTHSVFGAFVFGLVIPNGPLGVTLIEKLEDFVSGLLLPLFFAMSGLKTDVATIKGTSTWGTLFLVISLACAGKVIGTLIVAVLYQMPVREGVTLGLLMNTKGLVELIVLNVGKDQKVLDDESFAIMVIVAVTMTGIIMPSVTAIYRPARRFIPYKRRTIQRSKPDAELTVLVCIHTPRNVPTIINLLEASHATRKSPICVYILHLVELTGRASAMLIVHNTRKSGRPALNRTQAQSDHIINAFENYEQHSGCVSVQPLTAISPYSTMHEDICNLAEDKRVAFIIIPFHKQQTVDGGMEATNPAFRLVNQNVLANAPCSVGILVDRGLSGSTRLAANQVSHHVAVLFFGGPDDREALSYARRMSEHPGISLTVMRFLPGEDAAEPAQQPSGDPTDPIILTVETENEREKQLDEVSINKFRMKNASDDSIYYIEKVVNNGEETVAAIRSMDNAHDLFIVGRGQGMISPLTAGLTDWSECPELGAIGDLLASSDFAATVSVLVVQQYVGAGQQEMVGTPDSTGQQDEQYGIIQQTNRRSPAARVHAEYFP
ncbi:putative Na(+)/H(+) antiporter [Tripterygium wilfordii]|uniref:Putative Na(+)/H(+) antiporter n=1 Tax=Tripterygium wilfordii TaxID=458696 RepID=A0A7J7DUP3_TRIWF|nr:cation/H(+) antiporter 15-like [Tripterygium wilfordii]KAF5750092.1 putative Na(+)/H(+) antiporter [Tripterygium wilfordii]